MKFNYIIAFCVSLGIHAAVLLGGGAGRSANAPFDPGVTAVSIRFTPSIKSAPSMQQPQPEPVPIATPRVLASMQFESQVTVPLPSPQIQPPAPTPPVKAPQYVFKSTTSINVIQRDSDMQEQGVLTPAKSIGLNMPKYPPLSRRRNEEGTVTISVKVSADGHVDHIDITQSSGHTRLDNAAVKAVKTSRFIPARRGSSPVASTKRIAFTFRLENR